MPRIVSLSALIMRSVLALPRARRKTIRVPVSAAIRKPSSPRSMSVVGVFESHCTAYVAPLRTTRIVCGIPSASSCTT